MSVLQLLALNVAAAVAANPKSGTAPQVTRHPPMRTREGCKVEQTDTFYPLTGNLIAEVKLSTRIDFEAVDGVPVRCANHHSSRDFVRGEAD